jgi:hypothetical protein
VKLKVEMIVVVVDSRWFGPPVELEVNMILVV